MHNLKYSKLAKEDLFNILEVITNDKPMSALEYISKLKSYIELLQSNPQMGIECKNKSINQNCRILIYGNYLIFYKIQNNNIDIVRVLSSRTNYKKALNNK
ncbi:MAG: type II toxin-antitoxin system RelE/ParE family toxin [Campylobacterota bacterium]|nr:type II toxin-antitoxin system RelE/ParE family toxin [Campylobacterota bacterium]